MGAAGKPLRSIRENWDLLNTRDCRGAGVYRPGSLQDWIFLTGKYQEENFTANDVHERRMHVSSIKIRIAFHLTNSSLDSLF